PGADLHPCSGPGHPAALPRLRGRPRPTLRRPDQGRDARTAGRPRVVGGGGEPGGDETNGEATESVQGLAPLRRAIPPGRRTGGRGDRPGKVYRFSRTNRIVSGCLAVSNPAGRGPPLLQHSFRRESVTS